MDNCLLKRMCYRILVMVLFITVLISAQSHFVAEVKNTGSNMTLLIRTEIKPVCNGESLHIGDEVGVFTENGVCVGSTVWNGLNTAVTIWGDNPVTDAIDGAKSGEALYVRIWCNMAMREYDADTRVSSGILSYRTDGIMKLSHLSAHLSKTEEKSSGDEKNNSDETAEKINNKPVASNNDKDSKKFKQENKISITDNDIPIKKMEQKNKTIKSDGYTLLFPVNQSLDINKPVMFSWKNNKKIKKAFIVVASDSSSENMIKKIAVSLKETEKEVELHRAGEYWWHIQYTSGKDTTYSTQSESFSVNYKVIYPDRNEVSVKNDAYGKELSINYFISDSSDVKFILTDNKDTIVKKKKEVQNPGRKTIKISTENMKSGTYYYSIETNSFFYKSYFDIADTEIGGTGTSRRK